jgi:EAL domain-containing protein (putative c-di-GMP-specific phosphodiesterase class I)/FixJ family two-component response regulator
VARVAEAEFALLLENPDGLPAAEETAWNVHRVLAEAVTVDDQEVFLDPFVGIAICPQDGGAADTLKHAIVAAAPRHRDSSVVCRFYSAEMDEDSRHRFGLDAALRRALERNEFVLHYQPQVDLASGRLIGAEALLRWQRADQTLVAPQDFIPLLEDNGMIVAVGEWVLQEACHRARQWQDEGLPPLRMAINLSVRQFQGSDIRAMVRRALEQSQLAPERLELEITEGIVLLDADSVIRTMHDLNGDGVSHALDDFGTGYSSLSYLQRLPVARIKIDRSFVTNLTSSPSDAAIARAMVGMAHSLGVTVIAEGVETEGQLGFLRGLGCEEMQGYLFSRPLPADEFATLLREGRGIPLRTNADKPERVLLVVDDEMSILSSLNRLLRRHGYRIFTTTSTSEGFDLLATHPVGVVVCDQRMPGMTGTEFLRRVKELHPHVVRIVLSGYTELNSVIDAVNRGAVYKFLTKPWDDETLMESLDDAFRLYEMGHENREMSRLLKEKMAEPESRRWWDGESRPTR